MACCEPSDGMRTVARAVSRASVRSSRRVVSTAATNDGGWA